MELMDLDPVANDALYAPLVASDAFRLMILQPAQRHDPVIVHLRSVSAATSLPQYDAISYVWGNPDETILILCNGLPTKITVNLHAALVQVRSLDVPRLLWADALCINQKDKQERGQQVTIMGAIYSRARLVLACMGYSPDGGGARIASFLAEYAPVMKTTRPPTHDPRWPSFAPLLQRNWFTRAWVLQEVGLAQNPRVVYDNVDFSYRDLMAAVKWLTFHDSGFAARTGIPGLLIHLLWTDWSATWAHDPSVQLCEFLDLLDHGALLACRDPRDHIYAFLGHPLAVQAGTTGRPIIPDYEKSVGQVYTETTVFLLQQTGLRTLSSAEHTDATLDDFTIPSWVVRWNVGSTLNNIHIHPAAPYRACGSRTASELSLAGDILQVHGLQFDTVKEVYQLEYRTGYQIRSTNQSTGQQGKIHDLLTQANILTVPTPYFEPQALALAQTLCAGRVAKEDEHNFVHAWNAFRVWNEEGLKKMNMAPVKNVMVDKLWHQMTSVCRGRALIVTSKGHFGLAPPCSKVGDVCSVFDGGIVPFLLRPIQSADMETQLRGDHRLLGEAYIHGVMQGEAVSMLERGEAVERVFNIF
ncbi:heterokaryon incompatibility protein-domain-containing protein [Coniochaeta sp. 2T2.1]|nr:heterokaryon incompatibility protein-domain-containing protein [Coniochaeta sp. 2T2.1]